jgi:hypothetical protein
MLFSVIMSDNKQYTNNECVDRGEAKKEREKQYVEKLRKYRVSINSFPNYKHLLQENYVEYRLFVEVY